MYQYELEYFNPFYFLNSLVFLLTREHGASSFDIASGISLAPHEHSFEGIPLWSCAWLTLYRNEELKHVIAPGRGRDAFAGGVRSACIDAYRATDVASVM